ncbi:MAG TPA: glucosidase, partial [Candidatus Methylomirabilis sp.]|nr:glucosidase [Candidatus Methylomirabilis sp.]
FTENETNNARLFKTANHTPHVKDGINNFVVHHKQDAVNPARTGTKAAADYQLTVGPGETKVIKLRLRDAAAGKSGPGLGQDFDEIFAARLHEADEFYASVAPATISEDRARILRQALAGMLWTKQFYSFEADTWLEEHHSHPLLGQTGRTRNQDWYHMVNDDVISMPDKWEYPWYAAWDLAFHCIALSAVDTDFAKHQLDLMLRETYMHPSGQIPAYEWNYSDVNPPVHAWATLFLHRTELALGGEHDLEFLKRSFLKLSSNFNWWVNRKDRAGKNVFEGGFLGLDNIGVFDRSAPLPTGGTLDQADGTAWMAFYCQNMIEMALILADHDPQYEEYAFNFLQHFTWIAYAMDRIGDNRDEMWDEADGFYY